MVLLLNPVTPHVSHALWQVLGTRKPCSRDRSRRPIRRAGARCAHPRGAGQQQAARDHRNRPGCAARAVEAAALAEPNVAKFLEGQAVKKVIVVPGKIVNIVGVTCRRPGPPPSSVRNFGAQFLADIPIRAPARITPTGLAHLKSA